MRLNPKEDGITHINIYSKGKTELGRWLSNWAQSPFTHLIHGEFSSIEGFWYWLGNQSDVMRPLYGYRAKEIGRALERKFIWEEKNFRKEIKYALKLKLESDTKMQQALKDSILPLEHYYVYNDVAIPVPQYNWITEWWEDARKRLNDEPIY